ncbi:DnaJ-domain-containing protein [Amniculicola lignicola CBS 123094]|uniref:DnaJ-domain-containing protein n=1 Tax=Amniculicola lignicola CBS 123094 TaxID=1392246 RepID=A0A6A5W409_9PLEO|nr:DnaJ-domain-containing protein [Amniculicola lignicola CBS 123094]
MTNHSYYDELGVEPTAHISEIKKAFHRLSLNNHPDKTHHLHPDERNARTERFKIISNAYEVLSNQRGWYDTYEMGQRASHDPDAYTWRDNATYKAYAESEDDYDRDDEYKTLQEDTAATGRVRPQWTRSSHSQRATSGLTNNNEHQTTRHSVTSSKETETAPPLSSTPTTSTQRHRGVA